MTEGAGAVRRPPVVTGSHAAKPVGVEGRQDAPVDQTHRRALRGCLWPYGGWTGFHAAAPSSLVNGCHPRPVNGCGPTSIVGRRSQDDGRNACNETASIHPSSWDRGGGGQEAARRPPRSGGFRHARHRPRCGHPGKAAARGLQAALASHQETGLTGRTAGGPTSCSRAVSLWRIGASRVRRMAVAT